MSPQKCHQLASHLVSSLMTAVKDQQIVIRTVSRSWRFVGQRLQAWHVDLLVAHGEGLAVLSASKTDDGCYPQTKSMLVHLSRFVVVKLNCLMVSDCTQESCILTACLVLDRSLSRSLLPTNPSIQCFRRNLERSTAATLSRHVGHRTLVLDLLYPVKSLNKRK